MSTPMATPVLRAAEMRKQGRREEIFPVRFKAETINTKNKLLLSASKPDLVSDYTNDLTSVDKLTILISGSKFSLFSAPSAILAQIGISVTGNSVPPVASKILQW
ncbi:hypothetical protein SK355_04030 [Candidatus Fukatsuia symbiotica]|uniref:Uncharacterized protein n=1 Tax=Candidatus Fukatsuia symbiotica TaxID=1878942 RepID=A0A2U8I4Z6_9GAMM|nr:hypothetical protein [Candidatus Fukatsuia symbiotica]AWK14231.1 hypothetical protein CCS41_06705 [Candidatus Fukatsuia symbiotica]MEA9444476.1 hypothetical protein [Candidatus Fukatsuia symbiotica]